jgi:hypothetical protein
VLSGFVVLAQLGPLVEVADDTPPQRALKGAK